MSRRFVFIFARLGASLRARVFVNELLGRGTISLRLLAVLGIAGAPALSAQRLARLQARADSLAREWRQANAIADALDTVDRTRVLAGRDTIREGGLTIIANPSPLPLREAARRAWPVIDSLYGVEAQQVERRPYTIVAVDPDTTVPRPVVRSGLVIPWDEDVASLTRLLLATVPLAPTDTAWQTWLGGRVVPPIAPEQQRAAVYVELVTAPSQAVRRCFVGDLSGCRDALELSGGDDPLRRQYTTAADRRRLVLRMDRGYMEGGYLQTRRPALEACVAGRDSACVQLLRAVPPGSLPKPLSNEARETLVNLALRLGGRGAYHALVSSVGMPIGDRLARAAGVGIDSLLSRWRGEIIASRPAPVTLPSWGPWIAIAWAVVFGACGLRSSRWRVS